jgi:hypothetical protein
MAISKNSTIDFAKIAGEMRGTVARWYNAEVEIIDPNIREQDWDEFTNEFIGNPETIIWSGSARVQPIKIEKTPDMEIMQGGVKGVRVQIPYDANLPLIRKGLQVRVTDGGEDAVLENLVFLVRSSVNSSYGWNRTIECDVDVKSELGPDGS